MVNATEMAKPFGKRPIDWLRLPSTAQFIETLEAVRNSHRSDLVNQINGVGTWLHKEVAVEFASWLNPEFEILSKYRRMNVNFFVNFPLTFIRYLPMYKGF